MKRNTDMFTKTFSIPYFGLDMNERLKTGFMLQFFQETAALHARNVGVGVSDLLARGMTWVLRRYRVRIHSLPRPGELTVRTWYEPQRNLVSVRLFELVDSDGSVSADAWSGWIVIDLERGRPIRLDRALTAEYYDDAGTVAPASIEGVEDPGGAFGLERDFRVRLQELDLNGHTNHTVYFDWAMESLPDDVPQRYSPTLLDAEYFASASRTDVTAKTKKIGDDPLKFAHSIMIKDSGALAARLVTTWSE